jgi:competence protein ComEA
MRSRRSHDQVAEVARRRLELLSAELAEIRSVPADVPSPRAPGGSGELTDDDAAPSRRGPASVRPVGPVNPVDSAGRGRHARRPVGVNDSLAGWAQDRLPATLQGRVRMSPRHLGVLALLVLGALGLTGWWFAHAGVGAGTDVSPVVPVPASSPSALVSAAALSSPAAAGSSPASPSPTGELVVDVTGKVRHPGIVTLRLGSRVVDAVHAAGGARKGVSLAGLNLARPLDDGEQVVVGVPAVSGVAAPAASATASAGAAGATPMVNVNSAGQPELEELPGVGPVTAQAILSYRQENGAFTSVDQLLDVSGIGDATLAKIAPFVTL